MTKTQLVSYRIPVQLFKDLKRTAKASKQTMTEIALRGLTWATRNPPKRKA